MEEFGPSSYRVVYHPTWFPKDREEEVIRKIRLNRDDIAWIGITVKGTNAIVKIKFAGFPTPFYPYTPYLYKFIMQATI